MVQSPEHVLARLKGVLCAALATALLASASPSSMAATGSTVVGATVPGSTVLSTTNCTTGQAGRTDFGAVAGGTSSVTPLDCEVVFGASSDTSMLRMFQADGGGVAMSADPGPSVVAHWPVNGDTRNLGTAGVLTLAGGTSSPTYVAGRPENGQALFFDGSNDRASVPHVPAFALDTFTVDFWISDPAAPGSDESIMINGPNSDSNENFDIFFQGGGQFVAELSVSGSSRTFSIPSAPLHGGAWHHVAVVVGGNRLRVYFDGAEVGTSVDISPGTVDNPAGPIQIGHVGGAGLLSARLDEIRVTAAALSGTQLRAAYAAQVADYAGSWGAAQLFGACLRSVATGAVVDGTTWAADTVDADCADGTSDPWRAVAPTSLAAGSKIAHAPLGDVDAQVNLRFGFKAAPAQELGTYSAPLVFEMVAPNA